MLNISMSKFFACGTDRGQDQRAFCAPVGWI